MEQCSFIDNLNENNLNFVYVISGKERFFIDRIVEKIKRTVLSHPMGRYNLHELKGNVTTGNEIIRIASQIPMMATKCLVIVEDAHKLSTESQKDLETYLNNPSPTACLVLIGDSFDARRALTKTAKQRGFLVEFNSLKESDILSFIRWRAKSSNVRLSPEALSAIAAAVGPDCGALDDAVQRLGLFVGTKRCVEEDDVSETITTVRQHSVFELVDAVGRGDSDKALSLLEGLLKRQEEPIALNAMLARHIRQLLKIRIHLHLGTDEREFASISGSPPFMIKKLITQARGFRGTELEQALLRLSYADYQMKSARRSSGLIMEETLVDLCPPKRS